MKRGSCPAIPGTAFALLSAAKWLGTQTRPEALSSSPVRPAAPSESGRGLRVLLAEDNIVNQMLAVRLLEKRGHTVEVAANGKAALAAFQKQHFDLVLMDVQMPEMNGFDATAAIRQIEQSTGAHTPIIAMTAHAMKGDRERCLAAGMDDYVSKPIRADVLLQTIERVIIAFVEAEPDTHGHGAELDRNSGGDPHMAIDFNLSK